MLSFVTKFLRGCAVAVSCVWLTLAGCGGSQLDSFGSELVAGSVTLDSEPVVAARIRFIPTGTTEGFGGYAVTNALGQYMVESQGAAGTKGLPEGKYKVVIESFRPPEDPNLVNKVTSPEAKPTQVPARYSREATSPLEAIVMIGGGPQNFELTSGKK